MVLAGMTILDLGCGWGSAGLYMAEKYPNSKVRTVTAVYAYSLKCVWQV